MSEIGGSSNSIKPVCLPASLDVESFIDGRLASYTTQAGDFIQQAQFAINDLRAYRGDVTFANISAPGDPGTSPTLSFTQPSAPTLLVSSIQPPQTPATGERQAIDVSRLSGFVSPEFDLTEPVFIDHAPPTLLPLGQLPTPPSVSVRDMPEYQGMDLPPVPDLIDLNIPDMPDFEIPSLDVARPDIEAAMPVFYQDNYLAEQDEIRQRIDSHIVAGDLEGQALRARWHEIMEGGTGLPVAIEQMIFDQGAAREEQTARQEVHAAQTEWAARGFSMPGSTLLARESEVRTRSMKARSELNREVVIARFKEEIEMLKFAVQQGVVLEKQYLDKLTLAHDIAVRLVDGAYRIKQTIAELHLAYVQMLVTVYQADISAFRERVQVELSRLEAFRAQLDAEKARGEINLQNIELYKGRLQGVVTNVEVFKAMVSAVSEQIRGDLAQVEIYKGRLDGYRTGLESQKMQVDVYTSQLQGEKLKADAFSSQVQSFSERVRAFGVQVDAASKATDIELSVRRSQVDEYKTSVDVWKQEYEAQLQQVQAELAKFDSHVRLFSEEVRAEAARVGANESERKLAIDRYSALLQAEIERARNELTRQGRESELEADAMKASAQLAGQLASSALSAISLSAGINQSASDSRSCSYSESLSGSVSI